MALVLDDICRYTMNHEFLGRPAISILDMHIIHTGDVSRATACYNVAGDLLNNWTDHMMGIMSIDVSFESVSWVDLDSLDGSTGSRSTTDDNTLPEAGGATGEPISASVALLVHKQATATRGQRQGRWFIPGATEQNVDGNIITSSFVTAVNGNLGDFLDGVSDENPLEAVEKYPVVLHTENQGTPEAPVIVATGASRIEALTVDPRVASQRRRNRP
uniref:Uncharacterized protein n=1 Tax=uncultured prokaryote TaxID=198431 RepID=A0A0H5Q587_9ZZZZ|nr:hypothetical protein [uncultured prokaryote]